MKIIKNAQKENRKRGKGKYYELHHILPKSLFPLWKNLKKYPNNGVNLTAREHFFCHQLLDKIYPGEKMFCALWLLANDGQNKYCIKGSREYERLKIRFSQFTSNLHKGNTYCKGIKWPKEVCQQRGDSIRGKNKGKTSYYNPETDEEIFIRGNPPEGFILGQSKKRKEKLKGRLAPNKGKKASEKTKENCRTAHLGVKLSENHRKNISFSLKGRNNWIKGRSWYNNGSEEAQLKSKPEKWVEGRLKFSNDHKKILSKKAQEARHLKYWKSNIKCIETNEIFTNFQQLQQKFPKGYRKPIQVCKGKMSSYLGFHFEFLE